MEKANGVTKPTLHVGALKPIKISTPVNLFEHLQNNCQPIATKERRYSEHDKKFISSEVRRLLTDGLIEPSNSPWRAQPLIAVAIPAFGLLGLSPSYKMMQRRLRHSGYSG